MILRNDSTDLVVEIGPGEGALTDAQRAKAVLSPDKTRNNNLTEAFKDNAVIEYAHRALAIVVGFMILSIFVLAWRRQREFLAPEWSYLLRSRGLVEARDKCPYYAGFSWADPDPDHLRHLLREVYESREDAKRRGAAAAVEVARDVGDLFMS